MSINVYNISGSPMGWRVLLGLEFKGLDYQVTYLSGSENQHKQDAFLRMNPHGKVPVLEYEGICHRESLAILGWLDEQFPDHPLFGETPDDVRSVWKTAVRFSDYLLKATSNVVFPVFNGEDGSPRTGDDDAGALDLASQLLKVELQVLDQILLDHDYLCGARSTAADAVAFPEIGRIMRALQTKPASMAALGFGAFDQEFPNVSRWRDSIIALPGHSRTVPPHWTLSQ